MSHLPPKKENFLLHGSQNGGIKVFQPRMSGNPMPDGKVPKVYALICLHAGLPPNPVVFRS